MIEPWCKVFCQGYLLSSEGLGGEGRRGAGGALDLLVLVGLHLGVLRDRADVHRGVEGAAAQVVGTLLVREVLDQRPVAGV